MKYILYFFIANYFLSQCLGLSFMSIISDSIPTEAISENHCLSTTNLNSKTKIEKDKLAQCVIKVLVQQGYKTCDAECYKNFTTEEAEEHIIQLARLSKKLIDEESMRRKALGYPKESLFHSIANQTLISQEGSNTY